MLGQKKKLHKQEGASTKKKWELEFEEDETKLENENLENLKVLPLEESEDDEMKEKNENPLIQAEKEAAANSPIKKENPSNDKKKKIYEWMSSSDDLNKNESSGSESEESLASLKKKVDEKEMKKNETKLPEIISMEDRDSRTVFANNLPFDLSTRDIESFFKKFGRIINMEVPKNEGAILNKGRAFIEYCSINEAKKALEANGNWIKGRQIQCTLGLINATSHAIEEKKNNPKILPKINQSNKPMKGKGRRNISSSSENSSRSGSRSRSRSNKQAKQRRRK